MVKRRGRSGIGETVERDALIARWQDQMPRSEAGWLAANDPLDGQGADVNVAAFSFALIERLIRAAGFANVVTCQIAVADRSNSDQLVGAVLHGWVRVDADTSARYRQTVERMLKLLAQFGVDGKTRIQAECHDCQVWYEASARKVTDGKGCST